ncbi:MAG TPA: molybdopterin converting factor subunit 1 [Longimicrobiaceae bacterium]|nr:molybdopterin converting factor subunit 1 [Longimicrobiaceae bacterium]
MTIRSLFFASYRDLAGSEELVIDLPSPATVEDLVRELRASRAGLAALPPAPVVAVNMEYAALSAPLSDGDEVAFIPPVAGG